MQCFAVNLYTLLHICSNVGWVRHFTDFYGDTIFLSKETETHIAKAHPEIDIRQIAITLKDPDELRQSTYKSTSVLFYRLKVSRRYVCVVVKDCHDGFFISTAMTTTKPKLGEVLYVKQE